MQNSYAYLGNFTYVFLLINAVDYDKLCRMGATVVWTDICSLATAPALLYYRPSMALCNICIHHIPVDYAGGRAPKVGAFRRCRSRVVCRECSETHHDNGDGV